MKILTKNGYIDSVAIFFELTDEQLERVKNDKNYYQQKEILEEFNKSNGDNAHIFGLCNDGDFSLIYSNLKELLKTYKTVSWWDKDMNEFKINGR
jgi:hypothetical protein